MDEKKLTAFVKAVCYNGNMWKHALRYGLLGLLPINKALATHGGAHNIGGGLGNPLKFDTFGEILKAIADFLLIVGVPLAVLFIVWGAFLLLTSGGNENRISSGKKSIFWAVIGLIVILMAKGITVIIEDILGVQ